MKVLITGASSGIGRDMARIFAKRGDELFLVARRENRLLELKNEFNTRVHIICLDLSKRENCYQLFESLKNENIDILINNAGLGAFGSFDQLSLDQELNIIDVNDVASHILTKLFLKQFVEKDQGKILNVCSSAAFFPGPLMATYYASKAYLYRLSLSIYQELKKNKSHVNISVLCPGPIATEFQEKADVKFSIKAISSEKCARIAVRGLLKNKLIIIPTFMMKCGKFFSRFLSEKMILRLSYHFQKRKK